MRIRKNAKISAILYTNAKFFNDADEVLLEKNLCQLNQSPWDIITFSSSDSFSSLYQVDDYEVSYDVSLAGNGSSIGSVGDFESVASKTSLEGETDNGNYGNKYYATNLRVKEEIELCSKRDVKGWQCGRVVKNGNTMCDHHISKLENCAVWTIKKKPGPVYAPTTGCQPCRTKRQPTLNPHDYYYYSGFGPSWGKKRGAAGTVSNLCNEASTIAWIDDKGYETCGVNNDNVVHEEKREEIRPDISDAGPMTVELNYIDNDKKGKMGIIGKKRGRKPIKARSLKSLM